MNPTSEELREKFYEMCENNPKWEGLPEEKKLYILVMTEADAMCGECGDVKEALMRLLEELASTRLDVLKLRKQLRTGERSFGE